MLCSIDGCGREVRKTGGSKGMCGMHYRRVRKHGNPYTVLVSQGHEKGAVCAEGGCDRKIFGRGLCQLHWERANRLERPDKYKARQVEFTARKLAKREAEVGRSRPSVCEICGKEPGHGSSRITLCYDHDHKTGKGRGWLCDRCNKVLGLVQDSVELLTSMTKYISDAREAIDGKQH